MRKYFIILFVLLAGCRQIYWSQDSRRTHYIELHHYLPEKTKKTIRNGWISIGMYPSEVRASWGYPKRVSYYTSAYAGSTMTYYYLRGYVDFKKSKVVRFHDF